MKRRRSDLALYGIGDGSANPEPFFFDRVPASHVFGIGITTRPALLPVARAHDAAIMRQGSPVPFLARTSKSQPQASSEIAPPMA